VEIIAAGVLGIQTCYNWVLPRFENWCNFNQKSEENQHSEEPKGSMLNRFEFGLFHIESH
jgi:hypothetical protein